MNTQRPTPKFALLASVLAWLVGLFRLWPLLVVCIASLWLITTPNSITATGAPEVYNAAKLGIFAWLICKVAALAYLGYWIDRLLHPRSRPSHLRDIERMAAEKRRAFIVSAAILAAGLIQ